MEIVYCVLLQEYYCYCDEGWIENFEKMWMLDLWCCGCIFYIMILYWIGWFVIDCFVVDGYIGKRLG